MATPAATYCNVGVGNGKNNYKLDYCPANDAGILTLTAAQYASSTGITDILSDSADGMMILRTDVDVDPIAENGYPRTESREMALDGVTVRSFDRTTGDHWIKIIFKVTHLPPKKPSVVVCQMHDENDDIIEFAVQPQVGYDETTYNHLELVCRINGTSAGIPKLIVDFQRNTVYQAKIRVGAIAAGPAVGWEAYIGDMVTPKITSSQAGMPAMTLTGTQSYFKWGAYSQTKHTGNGTGGLETDINEYVEVGYRDVQTFHNGEAAPAVLSFGTQVLDTVANVRWGTKTEFVNTAPPGTPVSIPAPGLPATLVNGDMLYAVVRARRTSTTSTPSTPTTPAGWTPLISTKSLLTTQLVTHTVRFLLFSKRWVQGDVAPIFTYNSNTATDLVAAQLFAVAGARYSTDLLTVLDAAPAGLDLTNPADNNNTVTGITYGGAASTTLLGPTGIATASPGSLALALAAHENNLSSGAAGVVTGGSDVLTWVEGGEGVLATTSGMAWANDHAIVPASGSAVSIGAKTATGTVATGKGWGVLLSLACARTHGRRRAA